MRGWFAVFSLTIVSFGGCREAQVGSPSQGSPSVSPAPTSFHAREHLIAGERLPELDCEGWLNGGPPQFTEDGSGRLMVIDVWARWCPFSAATAPGLVETYRKYKHQDISFVSLTTESQSGAGSFANAHSMPWVHGFGAALKTIASLGALNPAAAAPGYEVKPTLYLVRSNGEVLWCDGHARMSHTKPAELIEKLEYEIDKQIAANSGDRASQVEEEHPERVSGE